MDNLERYTRQIILKEIGVEGQRINSQVEVIPVATDITSDNIEQHIGDVNLVLDGTDNFETRFLINDVCLKLNIPWIYGGVMFVTWEGMNS